MSSTEALYQPHRKHAVLYEGIFLESWLHPNFVKLVEHFELMDATATADLTKVDPDLMRVETKEVYSFDCFSEPFLKIFNEELKNFYDVSDKYKIPVRRPNSMNNYGVVVNEIGMRPMITALQQTYLWPLARRLFPIIGSQFDDHHAFIVRYQADEDLGLDMHIDDSDVTFNVCLGEPGFTGATLQFCGMFGAPNHRKAVHTYHHQVGRAVMHLGSRRHGADDIDQGTRVNLIIWSHNHAYRNTPEYRGSSSFKSANYQPEEGPPDPVCLSYTHDRDYQRYKDLPERLKHHHFHPWCPPPGKEYKDHHDESPNKDIASQDEL